MCIISIFKWVWQWQHVHHKLSIDVALRKFCCQALCSSVSVTGYCVVIYVPIFGVCQCCKYAFFCVPKLCVPMFLSDHQISMCFLLLKGKKMLLRLYSHPLQQKNKKLCHLSARLKTVGNRWITLHCHGHIFVDFLHSFAPVNLWHSFGMFSCIK